MKLSIFFSHLLELAKQTDRPVEEWMTHYHKEGLEGVDLNYPDILKIGKENLQGMLQRSGLKAAGIYHLVKFAETFDKEEIQGCLQTAQEFGVKSVLIVPGEFIDPDRREEEIARIDDAFAQAVAMGAAMGVDVTVEDFGIQGSIVSELDSLLWLIRRVNGLKFTLDFGNFICSDANALNAYSRLKHRLVHAHLKDWRLTPAFDGQSVSIISPKGRKLYPAAIGEGDLPVRELLENLAVFGYDGYLSIEIFGVPDMKKGIDDSIRWTLEQLQTLPPAMTHDGNGTFIDMHAHIGIVPGKYFMPPEDQLAGMEKYHIPYAIISNIACGESFLTSSPGQDLQYDCNKESIDVARAHPGKFGVMLWGCPNTKIGGAGCNAAFEQLYLDNRDIVKGIKIHPDLSNLKANDPLIEPYLQMAEKYDLPVLFHTCNTQYSKLSYLQDMIEKYPKVRFILGHQSMCSDGQESLQMIAKYPNVYGDTCWVKPEVVKQAEEMGIAHKIMFGTDSPINCAYTYEDAVYYNDLYSNAIGLRPETLEAVAHKNAEEFFRLK